jgi:hypothetical protein
MPLTRASSLPSNSDVCLAHVLRPGPQARDPKHGKVFIVAQSRLSHIPGARPPQAALCHRLAGPLNLSVKLLLTVLRTV